VRQLILTIPICGQSDEIPQKTHPNGRKKGPLGRVLVSKKPLYDKLNRFAPQRTKKVVDKICFLLYNSLLRRNGFGQLCLFLLTEEDFYGK
jgi:hypothetical protein